MQKLLERRPSLVLISLIIAVLISLLFTSCATYENKKGYGCYGATGIPAARPSYRK